MQFLFDRLQAASVDQFETAMRHAVLDLLEKNPTVPINEEDRRSIASVLRWLTRTPKQRRRDDSRAKAQAIQWCLAAGERRGMSAAEARDQVAEQFGFPSGEALRKFMAKNARA